MSALIALTDNQLFLWTIGLGFMAEAVLIVIGAVASLHLPRSRDDDIALVLVCGTAAILFLTIGGGVLIDSIGHAAGWVVGDRR